MDHRRIDDDVIRDFFGSDDFRLNQFKNAQVFDYEGVKGRLLSSSYAPEEGARTISRCSPSLRGFSKLIKMKAGSSSST